MRQMSTNQHAERKILLEKVSNIRFSPNFIAHFLINLYVTSFPVFFNMNIKVTGLQYFTSDQVELLSYGQTVSLLISTMGIGIIMDKFGAKKSLYGIF